LKQEFVLGLNDEGRRLDVVLRHFLPEVSLSVLQKAIRKGDVRVNQAKARPEDRLHEGDILRVWSGLVSEKHSAPEETASLPQEWVLWESDDLLAVNKPSGLLVHPSASPQESPTLDALVRSSLAPTLTPSLSFRPGPLHRLDRETSGIIIFSRSLQGAQVFSQALRERQLKKTYLAVLSGTMISAEQVSSTLIRDENSRRTRVGMVGQEAITGFRPLVHAEGYTLAEVDLGTGRTHQIRVHAAQLGHPLAGDGKYGGRPVSWPLTRPFFLHSWKLSGAGIPLIQAPLPQAETQWLKLFFKFSP